VLKDLGSTNGTKVNGQRVSERELQDGDALTFGETTLTYVVS
jgi:pSer/pThr/pTyr-binding forkhead associated (FHA) protein